MKLDFPCLSCDSVVIDAGAYLGEWARVIYDRYGAPVISLEPVWQHYLVCMNILQPPCRVYKVGLAAQEHANKMIFVKGDASSSVIEPPDAEMEFSQFVTPDRLFRTLHIRSVDLMKMNIEGMEYEVLESMRETMPRIKRLYVQFHKEVDNHESKYAISSSMLALTHTCVEREPFVWEYWVRKDLSE